LKGLRVDLQRGTCPLCGGEENVIHVPHNCQETQKLREKFMEEKWLQIKEEIGFKNIVGYTKITDLRNLGIFLYKVRCRSEHQTI
jgi:hypothetical protein